MVEYLLLRDKHGDPRRAKLAGIIKAPHLQDHPVQAERAIDQVCAAMRTEFPADGAFYTRVSKRLWCASRPTEPRGGHQDEEVGRAAAEDLTDTAMALPFEQGLTF